MTLHEELLAFKDFKKNYNFCFAQLTNTNDILSFNDEIVQENDTITAEGSSFINVGYKLKSPASKALSNLFPYTFTFKGKQVSSIESVLQGLKFIKIEEQNLVLTYFGLDANNVKATTMYNWAETQILYWQGIPINRHSEDYESFIDELFISAIQNPLYRNIIMKQNKYILHSIGEIDSNKTVLTRYEFERQLNCLKDFLNDLTYS